MKETNEGFSLIELLVVVAIIGILAAIAIPQFAAYKTRSFNSRAESDLRNLLTSQEAYFVDHELYVACVTTNCPSVLPGMNVLSQGVNVQVTLGNHVTTNDPGFNVYACHDKGDTMYEYNNIGTGTGPESTINLYLTYTDPAACTAITGG